MALCVILHLRPKRASPAVVALTNSWQVSSLNETVMNQILQLKPLELVRLNQRQLLRVYPSNYRVDSSNFNPQPYWNAGCHMGEWLLNRYTGNTEIAKNVTCPSFLVAMNYQTEGRMLELNQAKFSTNGNCGYILKPKWMIKGVWMGTLLGGSFQKHFWEAFVIFLKLPPGAFNPMLEDPVPGHKKTQLILKIISGQQLPKPKDSMLGDRGEVKLTC